MKNKLLQDAIDSYPYPLLPVIGPYTRVIGSMKMNIPDKYIINPIDDIRTTHKQLLDSKVARIVLEDFTTPGITFQEITLNQLMFNVSFHNHGKSDEEVAEMTSTLLDLGADDLIELQNKGCAFPLLRAAFLGYVKTVEVFLSKGRWCQVQDKQLHFNDNVLEEDKELIKTIIGNANQLDCISQYYPSKLELFIRGETNGNFYLSRRVLSKLDIKYSIQQDIFIKIVEIIKLISNETKLSKDLLTKVMDIYNNLSFNHSKIPLDIIFNIEKFAEKYSISLQKALNFALELSHNSKNTAGWKIGLLTHLLPEDIISIIASHDPILLEVYNDIGQRKKDEEKADKQKQIENAKRAMQKQIEYEQFAAQSIEEIEANFHAINIEYKKLQAVALVKVICGACGDEVFDKNDYTNTSIQIPDTSNKLFYFNLYRSKTRSLAQEKLHINSQILMEINAPDTQGRTPLIKAAQQGNDIAIKYIFENMNAAQIRDISFNMKDLSGKTALHYLVAKGMQTEARLFLEKGANPYIPDDEGYTSHMLAVSSGHAQLAAEMVRKFGQPELTPELRAKVFSGFESLNAQDESGDSLLTKACKGGKVAVIKYILKFGISNLALDLKNLSGQTALHILIEKNMLPEAKLLLEKGANPYIEDRESHSAYSQALATGAMQELCALMIQKFGPTPNMNQADHKDDDVESTFSDLSDLGDKLLELGLAGNLEHHADDF